MNQFAPILPELIITIGAIVLMMVAAFGGRRSGGFTSWASVAVLIAATIVGFILPIGTILLLGRKV